MEKKDFLEDLCQRLSNSLPDGFKNLKKDVEKNFHTVLQKTFAKLDLVTREEFDAQTKVLARTRQKLEALQHEIQELEKVLHKKYDE